MNTMKMKRLFTLMVFLCAAFLSQAQTSPGDDKGAVAAIKTNLPYWGVGGTFNLGAEFRLARPWRRDSTPSTGRTTTDLTTVR